MGLRRSGKSTEVRRDSNARKDISCTRIELSHRSTRQVIVGHFAMISCPNVIKLSGQPDLMAGV